MCDLLAPLLVILDDGECVWYLKCLFCCCFRGIMYFHLPFCSEALAFSCFTELMKRMNQNFPHGGAMDTHFANMRSLIQVKLWLQISIYPLICAILLCLCQSLHLCRSWTPSSLSWCTRTVTTPTSTSAIAGSSWTLNEVTEHAANPNSNTRVWLCLPAVSEFRRNIENRQLISFSFMSTRCESSAGVASPFLEQLILLWNMSHPFLLGV